MNTVLLNGIVGSTAYNLADSDSDVDRLGIFAVDTVELHGLRRPVESIVRTHPDRTLHEVGKWCRLALNGNPTVMELVWLPRDLYEESTELGEELIALRGEFLSASRVRDAYLGYATQQFYKLQARGDGSFSADTRKRMAKHARHLLRLLEQGVELHRTGTLTIRLSPEVAAAVREFGDRVATGDVEEARVKLSLFEEVFRTVSTPLPAEPNVERVERWLREVRRQHYASEK